MRTGQRQRQAVTRTADFLDVNLAGVGLALPNPLRGQALAVPRDVRLGDTPEGDAAILWNLPPSRDRFGLNRDWGEGGTAEQAFWAFLKLADEDDPARFVAFVRRFGTLGLWDYQTPDGHKVFELDYWVPSMPDGIQTPYRYTTFWAGSYWEAQEEGLLSIHYEPTAEWRRWARWLAAAIGIAYELRSGRFGSRRHWAALDADAGFDVPVEGERVSRFGTDATRQCRALANVIQRRFLRWSGLVPAFTWETSGPSVSLALGGRQAVLMRRASMQYDWPENCLFPALVAQLLASITAGQHLARCSRPSCNRLHQRNRRPRPDQASYCSDTCRVEARRKTKRESMARMRAEAKRRD